MFLKVNTHTFRHTKKQSTLSLLFSWSFQLAAARRSRVGTARVEVPGGMERHMARSWQGQLGGRETVRVCVCVCIIYIYVHVCVGYRGGGGGVLLHLKFHNICSIGSTIYTHH